MYEKYIEHCSFFLTHEPDGDEVLQLDDGKVYSTQSDAHEPFPTQLGEGEDYYNEHLQYDLENAPHQ